MRRNCNLELRLFPYSDSDHHHHHHPKVEEISTGGSPHDQKHQEQLQLQQQQLTIFYNGKICVSDVTELQARTILLHATREMEERLKTPTGSSEPCSPALKSPVYSPTSGLYMKRSLQCFLQKRNHRIQATSPYNH